MRGLACHLLILSALAAAACAQSAEQALNERHKIIAGWLGVVRVAESKYRSKYGVYGDLTALRDAHLLNDLIFESDNSEKLEPGTNFIPKSTRFEVTASDDGKHYKISISERLVDGGSIWVSGHENVTGFGASKKGRGLQPALKDGPQGPLLSSPE